MAAVYWLLSTIPAPVLSLTVVNSKRMNRKPKAIIVGAGIGGITAAIALRQSGIEAAVYERAPELKEIGAGIALASNAMKVLSQLGLSDRVAGQGIPLANGDIRTWKGEVIVRGSAVPLVSVCVHRVDLLGVLVEAWGADHINVGYECTGFEHHNDAVGVRFSNGEDVEGDFLIGADGIQSVVRAQIHGPERPRYAGYTAWRAVATIEMEPKISESWGHGRRFGIVPIGNGRVYWYATKNALEGELESANRRKQELRKLFQGWHQPIESLIDATDSDLILRNDVYDRVPLKVAWGEGLVTLLGDAAHPTTPNLGQGACQAIEDGIVLAGIFRASANIVAALRKYEEQRRARTAYITNLSWRLGKMSQWGNPTACWLRNTLLRAMPSSIQSRQLAKVLKFDEQTIH